MQVDLCWSIAAGLAIVDTIRGADFQNRHLLLALASGERHRVARAIAMEAAYVAVGGTRAQKRSAEILARARTLTEKSPQKERGIVRLAEGAVAYLEGRYADSLAHASESEQLFREHASGVTWELNTAKIFSHWSLFFVGELEEMRRRLPLYLREAQDRGDLYLETNLRVGYAVYLPLAQDDWQLAREEIREASEAWSQEGFHWQHFSRLQSDAWIDIYRGAGKAALERITSAWKDLERSLLLATQQARIETLDLRGRAALTAAAAETGSERDRLVARAEADARKIVKERAPWGDATAAVLFAGCATARGDLAGARAELRKAAETFAAVGMALHAHAAAYRLAELDGEPLALAAADSAMCDQKIQNRARFAALYVPLPR
jgi:hypothetical protein